MDNYEKFLCRLGNRIREHRKARNITIDQLAHSAGVSTQTLSHIENGRTSWNVRTLYAIEQALHITVALIPDEDLH